MSGIKLTLLSSFYSNLMSCKLVVELIVQLIVDLIGIIVVYYMLRLSPGGRLVFSGEFVRIHRCVVSE